MSHKAFSLVAGLFFLVIALGHVWRLASGWEVVLNGRIVPLWASWIGVLITGYLAYEGLRLSRRP